MLVLMTVYTARVGIARSESQLREQKAYDDISLL